VNAASAIVEGTLDDSLAKFLKKNIVKKELKDEVRCCGVPSSGAHRHPHPRPCAASADCVASAVYACMPEVAIVPA
jgi:hypothetical protein